MMNVLLRTAQEISDLLTVLRESRRIARQRASAIRQLKALSDRQLADIGIPRGRIEETVNALLPSPRSLAEGRRAFAKLTAMDDRQLADIGMTRATIPASVVLGVPTNANRQAKTA